MTEKNIKDSGVINILEERYSEDTILLIATAKDNIPSVRSVDTFFYDGSFWIVTDTRSNYVKEIKQNGYVMISDAGHNRFWCKAIIAGHPLEEHNKLIREVFLIKFKHWYKEVNNEELDSVCYIKAKPYKGYIHKNKQGYTFDLTHVTVQIDHITHHIDVKLEPFW